MINELIKKADVSSFLFSSSQVISTNDMDIKLHTILFLEMAVSVELTGYLGKQYHLGNHFFEIAAAYSYARRHGRTLCLPTRGQGTEPYIYSGYFENCLPFVRDLEGPIARYSEPAFSYTKIPSTELPQVCLQGYFQSERYFAEYKLEIRRLFQPSPSISIKGNERWGSLLNSPESSVLVHARRGDYLKAAAFHNPLPLQYFLNAMAEMRKQIVSPTFILMSDEPEFWKDLSGDVHIIDEKDPEVALYIMSQFKHYIIANSTFSWWASYLSIHQGGVVVAPSQWFGPSGHRDTADIYRKEMIRVDQT